MTNIPVVMIVDDYIDNSKEDYLINRAQASLKSDHFEAKAWMLTAQTLFPHKFSVQFEAYKIEKSTNNVKEAAKCLAALIASFPDEAELVAEVQTITTTLRKFEENGGNSETAEYCVQLFYQLPASVQRGLLLSCAEKAPGVLDYGKLMLLFFRKFPAGLVTYGPQLIENLVNGENHGPFNTNPVNSFRKLLVCDLLPMKGFHKVELQPNSILRLLDKAVEFYLVYLFDPSSRGRKEDGEMITIDDPWQKLWDIILSLGNKLGWDVTKTFANYWNKEFYLNTLSNYAQNRPDDLYQKQVAFSATLVMLRCIHEYTNIVENIGGENGYLLVEAFCLPDCMTKPIIPDEDLNEPVLSVGQGSPSSLINVFLSAVRSLQLLHSTETIEREYGRIKQKLNLVPWIHSFCTDAYLFEGLYDETLFSLRSRIGESGLKVNPIVTEITILTCYYWMSNHLALVESIVKIVDMLGSVNAVGVSGANGLSMVTRHTRHLHFLPLTRLAILNYCVKLLLLSLKPKKSDLALGHTLVLIQLNWPADIDVLNEITELIQQRRGFAYQYFKHYIVNHHIMEAFAFLGSDNGPKIPLDIFPANQQMHSQRRMSTRGVDKGAKEDFKTAWRGLVSRCNDPVDSVILRFLKTESEAIQKSLLVK